MNARRHDRTDDRPPAPHRSGDLHPLQYLRGDLSGRRDHATTRATTWSSSSCATSATTASRPAPPAPSTTGAVVKAEPYTPRRAVLLGHAAAAHRARESRARARAARRSAAHHRHRHRGPGRRRRRRHGRPRILTSTCTRWRRPAVATVTGNYRLTAADTSSDIRHIVLDFGATAFPVLEGQTLGIIPPGVDAAGQAAPRPAVFGRQPARRRAPGLQQCRAHGEARHRAITTANPVRGVASNYLCDLKKGDKVTVVGPYGTSFLMPNHPGSSLLMICTGTGSAPMRAMTERRRRRIATQGRRRADAVLRRAHPGGTALLRAAA